MSIFDRIRGLFTTKSKDEKKDMQLSEAQMMEELRKLSEKYASSQANRQTPSSNLNLTPLTREFKTNEEIQASAVSQATRDYQKKKDALLSQNEYANDSLSTLRDERVRSAEGDKSQLAAMIAELKDLAEKDTLKRGLGRSSIATGRLDKLDGFKADGFLQLNMRLREQLDSIDRDISRLSVDLKKALDNLDLDKAFQIDELIDKLKAERDGAWMEIIKYNNTLVERENNYMMSYDRYEQDILRARKENEARYGYQGEKDASYRERYNAALAFYKSLEPKYARQLIENNPELRMYLGTYYNKLLQEI